MAVSNSIGMTRSDARGPSAPYFVVGLAWFAFLMIALKVRMIEPVYLWVLTQGLLVEKIIGNAGGWWSSRLFLLAAYMAAAFLGWWLVERPGADPRHVWRRAALTWLGIQAVYSVIAAILVRTGVLYE